MNRDTPVTASDQAEYERRKSRFRRPKEWSGPPPLPDDDCDQAIAGAPPPIVKNPIVKQPVVDRLAVPPSTTSPNASSEKRILRVDSAAVELEIKPREQHHRESTSWVSSIVLHAIIVFVIALLVAPADYGGVDPLKIYLSWSEDQQPEALDLPVAIEVNTETVVEPEVPAVEIPAPVLAPQRAPAAQSSGGAQKGTHDSTGAGKASAGPRGSFFGIEADGHEFVYIVDTSGSMSGRRFRRATKELVRSINALQEDQHFYVFLFGNVTHQMFDQNNATPQLIPATEDNKARLKRWIAGAFKGGNTDPRGALQTSLKMNPSAIFMLSDGKFNGAEKNMAPGMFRGNADAFAIVNATMSQSPIHAIAFENEASCDNMKRLADMTNGSYRFAARDDVPRAADAMAIAEKAAAAGQNDEAERLYREIIEQHPRSQSAWKSRQRLGKIVEASAQQSLAAGDLDAVQSAIEEMIEFDPTGSASAGAQKNIVNQLLSQAEAAGEQEFDETLKSLGKLSERHSDSRVLRQATEPLAQRMFEAAERTRASDPVEAYKQFQTILSRFGSSKFAAKCTSEQQAITDSLLAQARQKRERGGARQMANFLRDIQARSVGTTLQNPIDEAMDELTMQLMAGVRDAIRDRNAAAMNAANTELQSVIDNPAKRERLQRKFVLQETNARELLRNANRRANTTGLNKARRQYQLIVDQYPYSLAADKAKQRIREADRLGKADDVDSDTAKMLELMLQ